MVAWKGYKVLFIVLLLSIVALVEGEVTPPGRYAMTGLMLPRVSAQTGGETCADSDGGLNYDVAGYVDGIGRRGHPYTKYDVCETGVYAGYVKEFYCNGTTAWPKRHECMYGCAEGACLPEPAACTDSDGDGYAADGGGCGLVDCDDGSRAVNPGVAEVCANGIDDDCDGLIDHSDPSCGVSGVNVIIVGWDGVQRDHFWQCYNRQLPECSNGLPHIEALSGGVILSSTTTSGDTATKPGWAQILSGYDAEVMGIYSNGDYQPLPVGYSVFEKIENHLGADNVVTMFVSGKHVNTGGACVGDPTYRNGQPVIEDKGQPWCLTKQYLDYYENDLRHNANVGNRALELLEAHQNDLFLALFLFREPDSSGHKAGENSARYSESIVDDDAWLGTIVGRLEDLDIYDRTLIYVATDHGFDEGSNGHSNAPYGIFASNDPLIARSGGRKDIAPTILERYGISLGALGSAPAVDGYSLYSIPPLTCVPEGEAYIDYPGAPSCCGGLQRIGLDSMMRRIALPATGGTGDNSGYCTNCGNDVCESPENPVNCPGDCPLPL